MTYETERQHPMNQCKPWPRTDGPKPEGPKPPPTPVLLLAFVFGLLAWAAIILAFTTAAHAAPPGYKLTQVHKSLTFPQLTIYVIQAKKAGTRMTTRDCYDRGYVMNQDFALKKGVNVWWVQPGFPQCVQFEVWQKKKSKVTVTRWDEF